MNVSRSFVVRVNVAALLSLLVLSYLDIQVVTLFLVPLLAGVVCKIDLFRTERQRLAVTLLVTVVALLVNAGLIQAGLEVWMYQPGYWLVLGLSTPVTLVLVLDFMLLIKGIKPCWNYIKSCLN